MTQPTPRQNEGRRWATSYALSLSLHAVAAAMFILLAVDDISSSTEIAAPTDVASVRIERDAVSRTLGARAARSIATRSGGATPQIAPAAPARPDRPPLARSERPASASPAQHTVPSVRALAPAAVGLDSERGAAALRASVGTTAAAGQPTELARNVASAARQAPPENRAPASTASRAPAAVDGSQTHIDEKAPAGTPASEPTAAPFEPTSTPRAPSASSTAFATGQTPTEPVSAPSPDLDSSGLAVPTVAPARPATSAPTAAPRAIVLPTPAAMAAPATAAPQAPASVPPVARPTQSASPAIAPANGASPAPSSSAASPRPSLARTAVDRDAEGGGPPVRHGIGGPLGAGRPVGSAQGQRAPAASRSVARAGGTPDPTAALNARLKGLNIGGDINYGSKHLVLGDAQRIFDEAIAAYDARLAPPPDILRRTFGFIYHRRTGGTPDSLAYVFDSYTIGPLRMCKAWKIVEHPYRAVAEVGAVAGSAGIGGAVARPGLSPDVRHDNGGDPDIGIVQFPCTEGSYTPVAPGSLVTPLPRHPDSPPPTLSPSPAPPTPATSNQP